MAEDAGEAQKPLAAEPTCAAKDELPKLNAREFAIYNSMAETMNYYVRLSSHIHSKLQLMSLQHNHFRSTWNILYKACEDSKRPVGMSIRQFISTGQGFLSNLELHHSIEERHIFPYLATKMPEFKKEMELLTQHKQIHSGMDKMEEYLTVCLTGERELQMQELKKVMDSFGTVLWAHL